MENQIIYIMGVSGSGKSTIGEMLSEKTGIPFFDGDDFHPEANINKMQSGLPLDDNDRQGWLEAINALAIAEAKNNGALIACSALKYRYRNLLEAGLKTKPLWIFLEGDFELISGRMKARAHFMPSALLQSQFDTLEPPREALYLDIRRSPSELIEKIITEIKIMKSEFGLVGLGVMGKSLALNLAEKGIQLSLFNRHEPGVEEDVAISFIESNSELKTAKGFDQLPEFTASLQSPKRIFLMVPSGAVDLVIGELIPLLNEGDLIIDGGNSHYKQTNQRAKRLGQSNIHFLGTGVSGGEKGARNGPSIMPGGNQAAYDLVKPILEKIAGKDKDLKPCCTYIGPEGAGHFVKMVHNGIEYAEMQLIAELYSIFRQGKNWSPDKIADLFSSWGKTSLDSYLLEITSRILQRKENGDWLIDKILDKAGNKGTGGWTTVAATELGVPIPMISAALFARYLSSFKDGRVASEVLYRGSKPAGKEPDLSTDTIKNAYELARIINHHQGFHLMSAASQEYHWAFDLSEIARIWTNGCIIRSALMSDLSNNIHPLGRILSHENVVPKVTSGFMDLKSLVTETIGHLSIPCFSAALDYLTGYTARQSSANILQAQRDFFGAHRYQRNDDTSGTFYHTEWE